MGYFLVCAACVSETGMNYLGKKISGLAKTLLDLSLLNGIRCVLMVVAGYLIAGFTGGFQLICSESGTVWNALASGLTWAITLQFWYIGLSLSTLILSNVICSITVLVPIFLAALFFQEQISIGQYIGLALFFGAIYFMSVKGKGEKTKVNSVAIICYIINAIGGGVISFLQKVFSYSNEQISASMYNVYVYFFAGVGFFLIYFIFKKFAKTKAIQKINSVMPVSSEPLKAKDVFSKFFWIVFVMSILTFLRSALLTEAAYDVPAAVLYPLFKGVSMILVFITSVVLLKEKPTWRSVVGLVLAIVSVVLVNVL